MSPKTVIVVDYSPEWPVQFKVLEDIYITALHDLEIDIQHVGSTSVQGLAAKPVIDIDIIINDNNTLKKIIPRLESIGYKHRGDLGIPQRESFKHLSGLHNQNLLPAHNLYVCIKGSYGLNNHLTFRDYLRQHPDKVTEYSILKKQLAAAYPNDMDMYVEKKTPFITGVLSDAGFDHDVLTAITNQNKA